MIKAAFLDRDGVINRKAPEGQYVTRWEEVQLLPGAADAIVLLKRAGFSIIVVSNQRCVARGLLTTDELDSLHQRICAELASTGAIIDGVYYCPHDTQPACNCRKPKPGMLLDAARIHGIALDASWMIGDSDSDVEAGKKAGCKTVRVLDGNEVPGLAADLNARSLLDATQKIIQCQPSLPIDAQV
jgi:D-glycero-D-manno-heptose 1,7-bisphosphate phosphatase